MQKVSALAEQTNNEKGVQKRKYIIQNKEGNANAGEWMKQRAKRTEEHKPNEKSKLSDHKLLCHLIAGKSLLISHTVFLL